MIVNVWKLKCTEFLSNLHLSACMDTKVNSVWYFRHLLIYVIIVDHMKETKVYNHENLELQTLIIIRLPHLTACTGALCGAEKQKRSPLQTFISQVSTIKTWMDLVPFCFWANWAIRKVLQIFAIILLLRMIFLVLKCIILGQLYIQCL